MEDSNFAEMLLKIDNIEQKSKKEKKYIAIRLHKQFGHPKSARLIDLIKTAGISDKDLLDMVKDLDKSCEICMRYKRPSSRPVVGFSLAHNSNETVAMDLKQFWGVYILHMVDHAIRYSAAAIISSKQKEVIINKIFRYWIAIFGTPNLFLFNNGGEFNNELFRKMGEQLNINIKTTAAESSWSNGIVEKQNGVIGNMMKKVMSDIGCTLEVALAWCISTKNLLLNSYGYRHNQLVFVYNPNFPSVMQNKPPPLEGVIASKLIALHLNVLHSARIRFIESEADKKLCMALRHRTRFSTSKVFQSSDQVFYKRIDPGHWTRPGTVIGHHNKVFVRHRGMYVCVSPCHLQLVSESEKTENVGTNEVESDLEKETEIAEPEKKDEISCNRNIDHTLHAMLGVIKNGSNKFCPELEQPTENYVSTLSDMLDQLAFDENDSDHRNPTQKTCAVPSLESKVRYQDPDTNVWRKALAISQAGKVRRKTKIGLM